MINLLPYIEKVEIRSQYKMRLWTVIAVMVSVLVTSALIPLIISYFTVSYNVVFINGIADKLAKSESFKETDAVVKTLKKIDRKVVLLNDPLGLSSRQNILGAFSSIFTIVDDINKTQKESLAIKQISYDQITKKGKAAPKTTTGDTKDSGIHVLNIKGRSSNRDNLLFFIKKLEEDKNFLNIDSPVSNLVNNLNIDFTLTITLKDRPI